MGRYIKKADLINEMPEAIQALTTNDAGGSAAADDIIEEKIVAAESHFEGYISGRYPLPYLNADGKAPDIVRQTLYTIVKYFLYARRNALRPEIMAQYDSAERFLMRVSSGAVDLPKIGTGGEVESSGSPSISVSPAQSNKFDRFI